MESSTMAPPAGATEDELKARREAAEQNGSGGEQLEGEGAQEPQDEEPKGPPAIELEGLGKQLSLKISGPTPDIAVAKLQGGEIRVPAGEYNPGDTIEAVVRLRCTSVEIRDNTNHATGEVSERKRNHKFRLLSIERTSR